MICTRDTPACGRQGHGHVIRVKQMFGFGSLGKMLILIGIFIIAMGVLLLIGEKIPWIGKLPGDIIIRKEKFSFYFPITTCIIISIILTLFFTLFKK